MRRSNEQKASLGRAADRYAKNLELAKPYLTSRGLDVVRLTQYRLGVVVDPVAGHEHAVGRLAIPYDTPTGVVAMKFRCIDEGHGDHRGVSCPKYVYTTGDELHLFNTRTLTQDQDIVVLTEGELDALAVESVGLAGVGYPGVSAWGKHGRAWGRAFAGVSVVVVADGDKPGVDSAERVARDIGNSTIVRMPSGEDANSFIHRFGWQAFYDKVGIDYV